MSTEHNIADTFQKIQKLLNPDSVAVVGASNKKGKVGNIIFEGLLRSTAQLFPVNPKEQDVLGHKAYAAIREIPDGVDVAVITIGAEGAVQVAEECAIKGIHNIIIVAGGFAEAGTEGKSLENRLKALAEKYDSRILGPNSLGVFVPEYRFDTIFVEHGDKSLAEGGGVAFITQSGSVGVEALGLASNTGFGMRAFVGLGNKVGLDEFDFLRYFGTEDPSSNCISLYVENIEHGRAFLEEARKIARQKPVIVLKAGRTSAGASAVSSHTGKLAGSDKVVSGAFRQFGVQRAYDDEELCDAAKVLSCLPPAQSNRVAVITGAGGFGVMCTDYIDSQDQRCSLQMAELSEDTVAKIQSKSLEFASCHNPIDLTAGVTNAMYINTLEALLEDDGVDIIICIAFLAPPSISEHLIDEIAGQIQTSAKPVLVFTEYGPFTDRELKEFYQKGVVGFPSLIRTVRAARLLVERGRILSSLMEEL